MTAEDKGHILREVYEDNRRVRDRTWNRRPKGKGGSYWSVFIILLVAVASVFWFTTGGDDAVSPSSGDDNSSLSLAVPVDSISVMSDERGVDLSGLTDSDVPLSELFDLTVRTVMIDAGHGGADPGASGKEGLEEKEITLDVSLRLARRLRSNHGLNVVMTRSDDTYLTLRERAEITNAGESDLFVSIHVNYFPSEPVYALETYYFGSQVDETSLRLAEIENKNSDYSVAEFNRMTNALGDQIKLQESRRLAQAVQSSLFRNTQRLNEDVSDWGIKSAPFVVLVGVHAPSILAEIGVISNEDEEARLATPEYREQLALFLEEGVVNYLRTMNREENQ